MEKLVITNELDKLDYSIILMKIDKSNYCIQQICYLHISKLTNYLNDNLLI